MRMKDHESVERLKHEQDSCTICIILELESSSESIFLTTVKPMIYDRLYCAPLSRGLSLVERALAS